MGTWGPRKALHKCRLESEFLVIWQANCCELQLAKGPFPESLRQCSFDGVLAARDRQPVPNFQGQLAGQRTYLKRLRQAPEACLY